MIESLILGLHLYSAHADHSPYINNANHGIYVRANDFQFGTYRNTYDKQTVYGAYQFAPNNWTIGRTKFEIFAGIASGYKQQIKRYNHRIERWEDESGKYTNPVFDQKSVGFKHRYMPFISPSVSAQIHENWYGRVFVMKDMIHLSTEWKF